MPAAYGLFTGTVTGAYLTAAVYITEARLGDYIYSLDDAVAPRPELLPAVVMPVGSLTLGAIDGQRLARSLVWGGAGLAAGTVVGLGVNLLLWGGPGSEDEWAAAVIGSAAGLLVGTVYGAVSYDGGDAGDGGRNPPLTLGVSLPL